MYRLIEPFLFRLAALFMLALVAPLANALQMGISVNPDRVRANEAAMVAITVTNDTAVAVSAVTLRLQMPASGVQSIDPYYASGTASCPGDCDPGEVVSWSIGTLAAGQGVRFTMPMTVSNGTTTGTSINFAAALLVGTVQVKTASQAVLVDNGAALALNVDVDRSGVEPGASLTYNLHYGNRGGATTTGTTLALPLPAGTTFVSATGGGALSGNTVLWSLGSLQGGQSGSQRVVVNVASGLVSGGLLSVDAALLQGTSAATGLALSASTRLDSRVQSNPALRLAMAANNDPSRQNEGTRTALTVSNPTAFPVLGTVLVVRMPTAGFNSIDPYFHTGSAACRGDCDPYEFVTWNLGTIAPRSSVTVVMANSVSNGFASGRLVNIEAELRADGVPMVSAHRSIAVDNDNALTLTVDVDNDAAAPGDSLTYTLTYGNRSAASTTGTTLSMPLPAGFTFASATGGGVRVGDTVQWSLNSLQAGQSAAQKVVGTVAPAFAAGTPLIVDSAVLAGTSAVTDVEVARASINSRVQQRTQLALAVSTSDDPARPNEGLRTSFTVSNRSGDTPAFGAVLRVRMPMEGFNAIDPYYHSGGATCRGDCDPYEFVTWNLGTLAPGSSRTVWLANTLSNGFASGRLVFIESELLGDGTAQVVGRKTLTVDGDNALSLAVHADKDSAAPGERVTYAVDYANRSTGTVNGTVLSIPVPAGSSLLAASAGGSMSAGRVSWNLAGLLAGTGGRRSITVAVPASAAPGSVLRMDAATIAGNSPVTGAEVARATTNTRVVADNPLRLTLVSVTTNPVLPNQPLTATWRVSNIGAGPLNTINLQARVPMNGVNTFAPSALNSGGQCRGDCDPYEFAVWNLPSLAAGASATFTMPMTVGNGFGTGRQIWLQAVVTDDNLDQAFASGTAMVGTQFSVVPACTTFGDFDGNGVVGFSDLALFKAAFGTSNATYDLDGNGAVNFADLAILKTLFGNASSGACKAGPEQQPVKK